MFDYYIVHKYLDILAIEKYLEQNVYKTLTPDISVPHWSNITLSSTYAFKL